MLICNNCSRLLDPNGDTWSHEINDWGYPVNICHDCSPYGEPESNDVEWDFTADEDDWDPTLLEGLEDEEWS